MVHSQYYKDLIKNTEISYKQSVTTSIIAAHVAAHHLKEYGRSFLTFGNIQRILTFIRLGMVSWPLPAPMPPSKAPPVWLHMECVKELFISL